MKDVVENEAKKEINLRYDRKENFKKLLTKICIDLKIDNYKEAIEDFLQRN